MQCLGASAVGQQRGWLVFDHGTVEEDEKSNGDEDRVDCLRRPVGGTPNVGGSGRPLWHRKSADILAGFQTRPLLALAYTVASP